ncbi:ras guanine nucleotide exchange factor domain-containing protein [Vararia minispora EC-137]|uniref:Ras guanine nucleotide exchange factor domain-containing protein n=1 Tax=Vararia minispora EC-137 TaxID=1314806 RepID=A0ACB8QTZ0_9AGAM|nr:ras guanine nucleotide exchange factor domain-containing protein [Vararia minispora EC-137]
MSVPHHLSPQTKPTSLRLLIQPSPAHTSRRGFDNSGTSPSPISALLARKETWSYESPSGEAYERICSVVCLYDFESSDADHLHFRKSDVLEVVKKESSGWWAAVRGNGTEVGWIPASYVQVLSDEAAEKVYSAREQNETPQYDRDNGSRSAPPSLKHDLTSTDDGEDDEEEDYGTIATQSEVETFGTLTGETAATTDRESVRSKSMFPHLRSYTPPPDSPSDRAGFQVDKSLPASPVFEFATPTQWGARLFHNHGRSQYSSDTTGSRRRSTIIDDQPSLRRLSHLIQTHNLDPSLEIELARDGNEGEEEEEDHDLLPSPVVRRTVSRVGKIKRLTGDDDAQAFHNAKQAQANLPWFLRPRHDKEEIKLEYDGSVKAGTLPALIERLVIDPLRMSQQEKFRRVFLMTFRTFAGATEVFELLISHYEMDAPPGLSDAEFDQWKREKLRPTQMRVLKVLTMWLEDHDLLNQAPEIAPRLQEFLSLIVAPPSLQLTAKQILASLERLTFADPHGVDEVSVQQPQKRWTKKKWKGEDGLTRLDPLDMAQQLCLYEHNLYRCIMGQECFNWTKARDGPLVKNMAAFTATYDRLADWIKLSVLEVDGLGKRANIVDFWIRVAEKCRQLNNFSSLSAIVAALSSSVITRLHFTWLNASRESILTSLLKINEPGGNYSYYRSVLDAVEGPCVPYAGPFLKMIVYAQDQHPDNVVVQLDEDSSLRYTLIHFIKRVKWFEASNAFLRFQPRRYSFGEFPVLAAFIAKELDRAASKGGERWFWTRSDEVQKAELVHADIKKGLQAAGF